MKKFVIIVAGGTGSRMHSDIPKQFMMLDDKPILLRSVETFIKACPGADITVALPEAEIPRWKAILETYGLEKTHRVTRGGETRFHSVKNALDLLDGDGLVAIHDGARPLLSESLITRAFNAAEKHGNAIPAIPLNESVRVTENGRNSPVDRSSLRIIQTPQVFQLSEIKKAYGQSYRESFTDDATVLEAAGTAINLVDGDPANIKITRPEDLLIAQALIRRPFQR